MHKWIYLDYAATTPVDPRVAKTMLPYFSEKFGNTMSIHSLGQEANLAVEKARKIIADFIHAQGSEILFTSSATESNNLVIKGLAFANKNKKKHIIVSQIEHECILESARWIEREGFSVTYLPVDINGFISLKKLQESITPHTLLVSIMHGNNEIGTVQDIEAIGKLCKTKEVYFHTDASQTLGKISIDVKQMNIDFLTASSHKIYGPKGAALLYKKKGVVIEPLLSGGGHEKGLRSSTLNVPAIIGFAKTVSILEKEGKEENNRLKKIRDTLIKKILTTIKGTRLNGDPKKRLSNNINISFSSVEGESLVMELNFHKIAVSTGSACSSKTLMPSHVLTAIGRTPGEAHGSLRLSLGRWSKEEDMETIVKTILNAVTKLRSISPLSYE